MNSSSNEIEIALKESEEKFRSLTESATDSIILSNYKGNIIYWNKAAEQVFGYSEKEIIGKPLELIMPRRYHIAHSQGMKRHVKTGKQKLIGKTIEVVGLKKGKIEFPIELSLSKWKSNGQFYFCGIIRDISERKRIEAEIKNSLEEKNVLLKEVHHRVKNNLQIINSLLNIYSRDLPQESAQIFKDCQTKIQSMARVHSNLYRSGNVSGIQLGQYIKQVCSDMKGTVLNTNIRINITSTEIIIDIDTAICCGLILSELLSNAFKHAFPNHSQGLIEVSLNVIGNCVYFSFCDNGVGFTKANSKQTENPYGIEMVTDLVNQIDGEIDIKSNSKGTAYRICFENAQIVPH